MGILNLFKKKEKEISPHHKKLLEDYEAGRLLQVDKDIDNKEVIQDGKC